MSASNNTFKWEFNALGLFEVGQNFGGVKVCMPIYFTYFVDVFLDVIHNVYESRLLKQVGYVLVDKNRCKKGKKFKWHRHNLSATKFN